MARAFSAKAGKDYPEHGIKKGETYWYWSFFRGRKQYSKTRPTQSQLTNSPTLSAAYAAQESFEATISEAATPDDLINACENADNELDSVIADIEETISNLEDGFPNGCPALEEKQELLDNVNEYKDEIESAKSEIESIEGVEEFNDATPEKQAELMEEAQGYVNDISPSF